MLDCHDRKVSVRDQIRMNAGRCHHLAHSSGVSLPGNNGCASDTCRHTCVSDLFPRRLIPLGDLRAFPEVRS